MAEYVTSYTTRYGNTFTSASDNTQDFVDSFGTFIAGPVRQPSNAETASQENFPGVNEYNVLSANPTIVAGDQDASDLFFGSGGVNTGKTDRDIEFASNGTAWSDVTGLMFTTTFGIDSDEVWGVSAADVVGWKILVYIDSSNWCVFNVDSHVYTGTNVPNVPNAGDNLNTRRVVAVSVDTGSDKSAGSFSSGASFIAAADSLANLSDYDTDGFLNPSTQVTYSNSTITLASGLDTIWDGQFNGSTDAQEVVIWGKTINMPNGRALYTSDGSAPHKVGGAHIWLINCKVFITGAHHSNSLDGNNMRLGMGPDARNNDGAREDTITGVAANKGSETSLNAINTEFIYNGAYTEEYGAIVLGDAKDVSFSYVFPNAERGITYPMNGSTWENVTYNASNSSIGKGAAFQLFSAPDVFDGISLINFAGYTGADGDSGSIEATYDGLSIVNLFATETSGSDNGNDQSLVDLYEIGSFSGSSGTTTNFVSPRSDFSQDGRIKWRSITTQAESDRNNIILRKDIQRKYDKPDGTGRPDVVMLFDTETAFTTVDGITTPPAGASPSLSKDLKIFTSSSDGNLIGDFDFTTGQDGSSGAYGTEEDPIHLPLMFMRIGSLNTDSAPNDYTNSQYPIETDITEMSLWGTRFVEETLNEDDILTSANSDGYYIAPDIQLALLDPDDLAMNEYDETESNIYASLVAADDADPANGISFNDIAANYKRAVWNRTITFDNWSTSRISGTTFDIADATRKGVYLNPEQVSHYGTGVADAITMTAPEKVDANDPNNEIVSISAGNGHIQTLKMDVLTVNPPSDNTKTREFTINGGAVEIDHFNGLRTFTNIPTNFDSFHSAANMKLNGSTNSTMVDCRISGSNNYYVFHNIEAGSVVELNSTSSDTDSTVLLTGTTDPADFSVASGSQGSIAIQKVITVVLDGGAGHDALDSDSVKIRATSATSASAAAAVASSDWDGDIDNFTPTTPGSTYRFAFTLDATDNNAIYAAIAVEGFYPVALTGVEEDTTISLVPIPTSRLNYDLADYSTWGSTDVSNVAMTRPTSNTDDIVFTINVSGVSITPTQATGSKVRTFMRREMIEKEEWLEAMALGYINTDFIGFENDNLTVPADADQVDRLKFNRTTDSDNSWRMGITMLDTAGNDQFDTQTKSGLDGSQIYFTPNASGAPISLVQNAINEARDQIVGHTDLPSDTTGRNVKEAYNQAKGAKNAAYAAG